MGPLLAGDQQLVPRVLVQALQLDEQIKDLASRLKHETSLLVFGRGYNYATCLESALKVKEVSYVHSEGILAGTSAQSC